MDTTTKRVVRAEGAENRDDSWIAVIGQWRKEYLRVPVPYCHAIELAGGKTKVLSTFELPPTDSGESEGTAADLEITTGLDPYDPSPLEGASGLVIPGGGDIDPELFGQPRHPRTHAVSLRRDRFELTLLGAALEADMPVLAICHGMQLLNVYLGGTLDQHLIDNGNYLDHYRDHPLAEPAHSVALDDGSILAEIMGGSVQVNTHHHQGLDHVPEELEKIGWAEDGVLEAVVAKNHAWVVGVQWHPEAMAPVDDTELDLFRAFVEASRRYEMADERFTAQSA